MPDSVQVGYGDGEVATSYCAEPYCTNEVGPEDKYCDGCSHFWHYQINWPEAAFDQYDVAALYSQAFRNNVWLAPLDEACLFGYDDQRFQYMQRLHHEFVNDGFRTRE